MHIKKINKQSGFTIIELMVVVGILAILAAFAIPAYQDYSIRAKVAEGVSLASGLKTRVSDYFVTNGSFPTNNATLGYTNQGNELGGTYVQRLLITGNANTGTITATFANTTDVPTEIRNRSLQLQATRPTNGGSLRWTCSRVNGNSGVPVQYMPSDCT